MQRKLLLFAIISILTLPGKSENTDDYYSKPNSILQNNHDLQMATAQSCRSFIPFSFDISTKLNAAQFKELKSFLFRPFLSSLFPVDIQPAPFSTYSEQNHGYRRPNNVSDITTFINNAVQGGSGYSFIIRPLKYFVDQNVVALATADSAVNTIIFAGDSLTAADVPVVKNYTSILTANGNTLTVVLVNPNIDQTNYRQVTGLKIVVWSDFATTIAAITAVMNCGQVLPSSTTEVTTVGTTTTPPSGCYIPFSFDVATDLKAAEFADLKTFLVNPFLSELFPLDVQPAWYSTYDTTNHNYTRPNNVSDIVSNVQNAVQSAATVSDFIQPLQYFIDQGVADLGATNGLPVNTIIFAGSSLDDVETASFLAPVFTTHGNTLTVVLVNPNIDQTNYRQVDGLNIVVWSDPETTVDEIKSVINCRLLSTTVSTTVSENSTCFPTMTTTTTTFPRPIDIVVVLDGSLCSSGIGNLNAQLAVLEKIFHEYTFGLNVRVAFANPINMDVEYTFVCDMASINATIQTINQYCEFAILDDQQRLNDSLIESMNASYNQHSPALAFLVLLQSNGTVYTNETDSVVGAAITFRENCLEPTNAKVVVVQVDNFYPVDPALASDGFFFNNTEDIGHRVAEAFITIRNYNATAYTCANGQSTSTLMTTTTTIPRPIDIVVVLDGSLCSSGIGNLNAQVAVLEKIFQEYTFGLNVRVAFANPINMDIQTTFVCDMASINTTIQTIKGRSLCSNSPSSFNLYCGFAGVLDSEQHLNDSLIESMNALYNQHSPALVFVVLLQSNGSAYTDETDSVVNATIEFRENCLEPTNAKVVVVQVDDFYPVDPALASDGFFFNNTADIGHRVAEAFENINDYNAAAYTCAPSAQNFASDPACYPNS